MVGHALYVTHRTGSCHWFRAGLWKLRHAGSTIRTAQVVANADLNPIHIRRCGYDAHVSMIRVRDAADLLGVSDDTVRRWIDDGTLPAEQDQAGRKVIPGVALAEFAVANSAAAPREPLGIASSARNRFTGLVTRVVIDGVMAQVEMKC